MGICVVPAWELLQLLLLWIFICPSNKHVYACLLDLQPRVGLLGHGVGICIASVDLPSSPATCLTIFHSHWWCVRGPHAPPPHLMQAVSFYSVYQRWSRNSFLNEISEQAILSKIDQRRDIVEASIMYKISTGISCYCFCWFCFILYF